MDQVPQHILITGTTSGIGRKLLEYYHAHGERVTAVNRRVDERLEAHYPSVQFKYVDVRDAKAVDTLLNELTRAGDLPDLLVLNAGVNRVDNDPTLSLDEFRQAMETNLFGALNFVAPLIALAANSRPIRILAVSSMTIYAGNPFCLGYSASKKVLTYCFHALAQMYAKTHLKFQWIVLGFVNTDITSSGDKFPKVMSWVKTLFSVSEDKAISAIVKLARSSRCCLIYPWKTFFLFQGVRLAQLLIPGFYRGRKQLVPMPSSGGGVKGMERVDTKR